jgi:hypothetical protein
MEHGFGDWRAVGRIGNPGGMINRTGQDKAAIRAESSRLDNRLVLDREKVFT